MKSKYKNLLGYFSVLSLGVGAGVYYVQARHADMAAEEAALAVKSNLMRTGETSARGGLLSVRSSDPSSSQTQDRKVARSQPTDRDASKEESLEKLAQEFLERGNLAAENEKLLEYFPDGKGANRSIRLSILLGNRSTEGEDAFSELSLANQVHAEIFANPKSSVMSLDQGLAKLPREANSERFAVLRLLSDLGSQNPDLRDEVKTTLLKEASRAANQAEGALVFTALLRVNSSKSWFEEVNRSFEKLHPGSELSDFVAVNVVAL